MRTTLQLPLLALTLLAGASSCAGIRAATPVSIEELRQTPVAASPGYTMGNGVPALDARFAKRPGLKLAILQMAYIVQGRPQMNFTKDMWSFGGVTTWESVTTPEVMVPPSLAYACAQNAATELEDALRASGFDVVPASVVQGTDAYARHYGDWGGGYTLDDDGYTVVAPPPLTVKNVSNIIQFATLQNVWPKTSALEEIKAELGEDVLFLCVRFEANTMQGLSGNLRANAKLNVVDPDFVGYGIGGYGHMVVALDALTDRNGAEVPGFIDRIDEDSFRVDWNPVYADFERIHSSFAQGFANTLRDQAFPPADA